MNWRNSLRSQATSKLAEYFMEKCETDPAFRKKVEEQQARSDIGEARYFAQIKKEGERK